jgi:glycosyltransferase involved in cell wall biosynthesis
MTPTPYVSVVTASLNRRDSIARTLTSVCAQSFRDFEHLVIDGGSSDGTVEMLQAHQSRCPLQWISEPDSGIADAMNKGVALARGKYVLFIHADDELAGPEVLQRAHTLLRQEECDIYSFPVVVPGPAGRRRFYRPIRVHWWHHFKTIIPHQGAFVHRQVFERIGGFRPELKIAMDYDFFYRAFQNRSRARFGRMVVARMGAGGVSGDPKHLAARLEEEYAIQRHNERHPGWRAAQAVWRALYTLYKQRGCSPPLSSRNTRS